MKLAISLRLEAIAYRLPALFLSHSSEAGEPCRCSDTGVVLVSAAEFSVRNLDR